MASDEEIAVFGIEAAIRGYFATHPLAADTAEGIQRWWLMPSLSEEPLALVKLALERLVEAGVTRRVVLENGRVIYAHARSDD